MKKHIPNLITCLNITSGTIAIFFAFNGQLHVAAGLVILAMVFDFFDGFAARLLHVQSGIGKELDSLADVVSFGVVPSILAFFLIGDLLRAEAATGVLTIWQLVLLYVPLLIPAFSAYRLAKFNLDERQTHSFIGLNTPSNALFWVMLVFNYHYCNDFFMQTWGSAWLLAACALLLAILLISELPMFSLKLTSFSWRDNALLYCFLVTIVIGFAIWNVKALSFMIPVYILLAFYDFTKKYNWLFWAILMALLVVLGVNAAFIIFPAYLIVFVVKLTTLGGQTR